MPRTKKVKSEAKQMAMTNNAAIQAWRTAAKEMGFLQAGKFVPIPAKHTPEYAQIKQRQLAILAAAAKSPPVARVEPPELPQMKATIVPPAATEPSPNPYLAPIRAAAADYGNFVSV